MPRNINKFFDYDRTEANIPSTILNFLAGLLVRIKNNFNQKNAHASLGDIGTFK